MPTRAVKDWLSEYKALPDSELHTYANTIRNNEELVDALYDLFEDDSSHEVLDPVCHQLFDFYRCSNVELQRFTLEALPVLIASYLLAYSHNDKKRCSGIEACLLGVYNLEVVGQDGKPTVKTYTIPTLAVPSVYHEPPSLATLALTESALLKYHSEDHVRITVGPLSQVERIHSQNRLQILTNILNLYNADIGNLSPRSHYALCKMASRVCKTGFENLAGDETEAANLNDSTSSYSSRNSKRGVQFRMEPRVQLTSAFLVELLNGIYFAMFNGQAREGIQALEDIHQRASYELYPDVLLVTNAVKNSLQHNPSGQPQDGPMGISIALSPSQGSPAFSKSAITNASFRTKKMPDDIDALSSEDEDVKPSHRPPSYSSNPSSPLSKEEFLLINSNMDKIEILDFYEKELEAREMLVEKFKSEKSKTKKSDHKSKVDSVARSDSKDREFRGKALFKRSSSKESESGRDADRDESKFGSFKRGGKRGKKKDHTSEDIDVPEDERNHQLPPGGATVDSPPHYDEVSQQNNADDKSSTSSKLSTTKLPKPLKSIMKKGSSASEKPEKANKVNRREKDADAVKRDKKTGSLNVSTSGTDFQDSHSPKNPKHSISMTTGLGMSGGQNGVAGSEFADPSMVGVSVIRSSSSATGRTFQMVDYIDLKQSNQAAGHKRASSMSEDGGGGGSSATGNQKGQAKDETEAGVDSLEYDVMEEVDGEDESVDTAL